MEGLYLTLIATPAPPGAGRTGFVISRKVSSRAVDRNRLRRKLREVLRDSAVTASHDVVLRVSRARNRIEQDAATHEAARLLATLASGR